MNKPREGNRPGIVVQREHDPPDLGQPLQRKVESGLAEPNRDTSMNRHLARTNGWTDAEYQHWVDTGDTPIRSRVKETPASRPNEIDDDERLHQ